LILGGEVQSPSARHSATTVCSSNCDRDDPRFEGDLLALEAIDGVAQVSLRFTAVVGNSSIDDVYVGPRLSH
jgi:hypothetical protein